MTTETSDSVVMDCAAYAKARKIKPSSVRNAIRKNHVLPGVISKEKIGRDWFFTVDKNNLKK